LGGSIGGATELPIKAVTRLERVLLEAFFEIKPLLADREPVVTSESLGGSSGGTEGQAAGDAGIVEMEMILGSLYQTTNLSYHLSVEALAVLRSERPRPQKCWKEVSSRISLTSKRLHQTTSLFSHPWKEPLGALRCEQLIPQQYRRWKQASV
jgi:hypothetical protein